MTEHERKILFHLNEIRSQHHTGSLLSENLKIPFDDVVFALSDLRQRNLVYRETTPDKNFNNEIVWKISEDGERKVNDITSNTGDKQGLIVEPDYRAIAKDLATNTDYYGIKDKIDSYYDKSPIKGATFFFKLLATTHHLALVIEQKYLGNTKRIIEYCGIKTKEILSPPKRKVSWGSVSDWVGVGLLIVAGVLGYLTYIKDRRVDFLENQIKHKDSIINVFVAPRVVSTHIHKTAPEKDKSNQEPITIIKSENSTSKNQPSH